MKRSYISFDNWRLNSKSNPGLSKKNQRNGLKASNTMSRSREGLLTTFSMIKPAQRSPFCFYKHGILRYGSRTPHRQHGFGKMQFFTAHRKVGSWSCDFKGVADGRDLDPMLGKHTTWKHVGQLGSKMSKANESCCWYQETSLPLPYSWWKISCTTWEV